MDKRPLFDQITIVGLGLIGGSLGLAARRRGLARTVVGYSRKTRTLHRAGEMGAIDAGSTDLRKSVEDADLVVLAVPVDRIVPLGLLCARWMKPGAILTDVGSTKTEIVRALERALRGRARFVGAHPVAGSEQRGIDAADAAIFDDPAYCILTPTSATHDSSLRKVAALWRRVVPKVVTMSPRRHDEVIGATSHLAHVLAFSLAATYARAGLPAIPRSFLDMTRIAKSDPRLWEAIFVSNQPALSRALRAFEANYRALTHAIRQNQGTALRRVLARGKSRRDELEAG